MFLFIGQNEFNRTFSLYFASRTSSAVIEKSHNAFVIWVDVLKRSSGRDWQSRKPFKQITNRSGHCLHHMSPAKRDETNTSRLRRSVKITQLFAKTNRFKNSFIQPRAAAQFSIKILSFTLILPILRRQCVNYLLVRPRI